MLQELTENFFVVKCESVGVPHSLKVVPAGRGSVITCRNLCRRVNLDRIGNGNNMLSGVSVAFAMHCNQLGHPAIDGALFLQFSQDGIFGVFSVVHEASGEGVRALEGIFSSRDEQDVEAICFGSCDDRIDCDTWCLVNLRHRGY